MSTRSVENLAGKVAIVGRPNVGKSALFNRLVGRNIAIVHDQPGITRDRLAAPCDKGPRPFLIWDTGGIGGIGETELTVQVRSAADAAMRESDVILFVVDAQHGLAPIDQELATVLRKARTPVVLVTGWGNELDPDNPPRGIARVLPKPYRLATVLEALNDALAWTPDVGDERSGSPGHAR